MSNAGQPRSRSRGYGLALALLASVFFMWGFISVLNDILTPHLKAVFDLNYTEAMLVQFVFFSTYFVMSLPAARLIERVDYCNAIGIGLVVAALGALTMIPAASIPSFPVFLCGLFILASGITLLQVAANPYVAMIGPPRTASARLNLVQAFNSLGDTLAPTVGGLLILSRSVSGNGGNDIVESLHQRLRDALSVRLPYAGIAIVLVLLAVVILVAHLPKLSGEHRASADHQDRLWRHPRLMFGIGGIFFYVGAEIAVSSFLINYISSPQVAGITHAEAAHYVTYFWGGLMVGRFLGSVLMRRFAPSRLLVFAALGAIAAILISFLTVGRVSMWSILVVGLFDSIMFPTIFTLAIEGLGPLTERGSGLLIMAIAGGAVLPLIQGALADVVGLKLALLVPTVAYIYILGYAVFAGGSQSTSMPRVAEETFSA